jgi:hydroxymethylbilane synthase
MLPAVGQGAMAVEIRSDDAEIRELLQKLNDPETNFCIAAERAFLRDLEGGCQVPIGANAFLKNDKIYLKGMVGNLDGSVNLRDSISGDRKDAVDLGRQLARKLIERGANRLLEETRATVESTEETVI